MTSVAKIENNPKFGFYGPKNVYYDRLEDYLCVSYEPVLPVVITTEIINIISSHLVSRRAKWVLE